MLVTECAPDRRRTSVCQWLPSSCGIAARMTPARCAMADSVVNLNTAVAGIPPAEQSVASATGAHLPERAAVARAVPSCRVP